SRGRGSGECFSEKVRSRQIREGGSDGHAPAARPGERRLSMRSEWYSVLRRTGLALLTALALTPAVRADVVLTITPVGNPTWQPTDFHMFTAPGEPLTPVGLGTASSILPPPNHIFTTGGVIIPGTPHAGPYGQELANGLANLGISDSRHF